MALSLCPSLALPSKSQRPPEPHSTFPLPKFSTEGEQHSLAQNYVCKTDQPGIIYNMVILLHHTQKSQYKQQHRHCVSHSGCVSRYIQIRSRCSWDGFQLTHGIRIHRLTSCSLEFASLKTFQFKQTTKNSKATWINFKKFKIKLLNLTPVLEDWKR